MPKSPRELLITLVLFSVATAAGVGLTRVQAHASAFDKRITSSAPTPSIPDAGEPDVGQSGKPATSPRSRVTPIETRGTGLNVADWIRWAGWIWAAEHCGVEP